MTVFGDTKDSKEAQKMAKIRKENNRGQVMLCGHSARTTDFYVDLNDEIHT